MNKLGFKKISDDKLENVYGGFIVAAIIATLPFLIQAVTTSVASFKAITSENGSLKTKDIETKWESQKAINKKSSIVKQATYFIF